MKVILRDDVEKLGVLGAVVNVRDGYARNYLLPRQLAYLCTANSEKQIEAEKKRRVVREEKKIEALKGVEQLDKLGDEYALLLVRADNKSLTLESVRLP